VAPANVLAPLDLDEIFGRTAPVEVDLGCGDGTFLAALAEQDTERNFLGVERLPGRIRGACRKIGDQLLPNARVLRSGILEALEQLLPPRSVEICYLLFPDPWPKRRHHHRRVVTEEFLHAVAEVLVPGGCLRIATDHAEYFAEMQRLLARAQALEICPQSEMEPVFCSTFESRFRERGAKIYRVVLQRRK